MNHQALELPPCDEETIEFLAELDLLQQAGEIDLSWSDLEWMTFYNDLEFTLHAYIDPDQFLSYLDKEYRCQEKNYVDKMEELDEERYWYGRFEKMGLQMEAHERYLRHLEDHANSYDRRCREVDALMDELKNLLTPVPGN